MENIKKYTQATVKIGEKILLLIAGALALVVSMHDPKLEIVRLIAQILGGLCLAFGLAPMILAYVKTTLTSK